MIFQNLCFCNVELITVCGFSANYTLHFHSSMAFWSFINIFNFAVFEFAAK